MPAAPAPSPGLTVPEEFVLLLECLATVADPRLVRGKVHPLPGVLGVTVLALMVGCRSLSAVSRFGQIHPEVLAPLGLRRSPSVIPRSRQLGREAAADVRRALRALTQRPAAPRRGEAASATVAAVDSTTRRGGREADEQFHILQVFARRGALPRDQVAAAPLRGEADAAQVRVEQVVAAFPDRRQVAAVRTRVVGRTVGEVSEPSRRRTPA